MDFHEWLQIVMESRRGGRENRERERKRKKREEEEEGDDDNNNNREDDKEEGEGRVDVFSQTTNGIKTTIQPPPSPPPPILGWAAAAVLVVALACLFIAVNKHVGSGPFVHRQAGRQSWVSFFFPCQQYWTRE